VRFGSYFLAAEAARNNLHGVVRVVRARAFGADAAAAATASAAILFIR
jgi:hypothetical protein